MNKIKLLGILLIICQCFPIVEACSVNTLRTSSFCSTALTANRADILRGNDSAPINCLSLEQYCQTIERTSRRDAHHSFERAIALYNAQKTLKDLTRFLNNRDVDRLQNELRSAFAENTKGIGRFSQFSVLNNSGFPLSQNEKVFFFGVQKKSANQLYVLEGRRNTDGAVRLVETKIQPQNLSVPTASADIALLVNNIKTQRMRYVLLNRINSSIFQRSDRIPGFYLKDMQIIVPVVSGMGIEELNTLGNELKFWLNLSGASTQIDNSSFDDRQGISLPESRYNSNNYSNNSVSLSDSERCLNANKIGVSLTVAAHSLILRSSPNGAQVIGLNEGDTVHLLNGVNQIVNNNLTWVCIDAGASGQGWVARRFLR